MDRIESCTLTGRRYHIPDDYDPVTYLGSAWGVLRGEASPPQDVALRFSARAGRWVCDQRWHPTQATETLPNGDLLMRFHCGVTPELVRWVLSYGAEVWIEEPASLREKVLAEAARVIARAGAPA